jgi:hypothetical protein
LDFSLSAEQQELKEPAAAELFTSEAWVASSLRK